MACEYIVGIKISLRLGWHGFIYYDNIKIYFYMILKWNKRLESEFT